MTTLAIAFALLALVAVVATVVVVLRDGYRRVPICTAVREHAGD